MPWMRIVVGWCAASGLFAIVWARLGLIRHRQLQDQLDDLRESGRGDGR